MYIGHARMCVCVSVHGRMPTLLQDPDVTWGNGRGCPLVVRYWAHDNTREREMSASACSLYSHCAWFLVWMNVMMAGKKLCDSSLTRAIPQARRLIGEYRVQVLYNICGFIALYVRALCVSSHGAI